MGGQMPVLVAMPVDPGLGGLRAAPPGAQDQLLVIRTPNPGGDNARPHNH